MIFLGCGVWFLALRVRARDVGRVFLCARGKRVGRLCFGRGGAVRGVSRCD